MNEDKHILNTEVRGEGDGLVLIHGFGGNICSWRDMIPSLSQRRRVVAVDLLGHGDSPKPDDAEYSHLNQARLVKERVDELLMNRFVLCGHSYGGAVALQMAWNMFHVEPNGDRLSKKDSPNGDSETMIGREANGDRLSEEGSDSERDRLSFERDRLEGIIIVSGAAYPQELPWHLKGMKSPFSVKLNEIIKPESQMRLVLMNLFHNPLNINRQIIADYAAPMRSPGYHHALRQTVLNLVPPDADELSDRYRQLDIPALLIWGEKDNVVPPKIGEKLHQHLPQSQFNLLPDCGHMPMHERPMDVLNLIINWLEQIR